VTSDTVTDTIPVGSWPYGAAVAPDGKKVYVTNSGDNNVSVIDTAINTVIATIPVGNYPWGVAVSPDGKKVYVANTVSSDISIIDTATNTVIAIVPIGAPGQVAVSPDGSKIYVTATGGDFVSVMNTTTNSITGITVGTGPNGVAVTPDGTKVYVANSNTFVNSGNTVAVINTTTNIVTDTVYVGNYPLEIAITPDGKKVYVVNCGSPENPNNQWSGTVSVIDTATNTITDTIVIGKYSIGCGKFIGNIRKTPTITWNNPTDITYGTKLSSTQLDATASVPGTFVYTPPLGTVLSTGTHTLTTSFQPSDTVNYTTASATASINVITPAKGINQMDTTIQNLVTSGDLSSGTSRPLISKLNTAESGIDSGNKATVHLNIFIDEVEAYIDSSIISETNGQLLINSANDIINALIKKK